MDTGMPTGRWSRNFLEGPCTWLSSDSRVLLRTHLTGLPNKAFWGILHEYHGGRYKMLVGDGKSQNAILSSEFTPDYAGAEIIRIVEDL